MTFIGDLAHLGERQTEVTLLSRPVQCLRLVIVLPAVYIVLYIRKNSSIVASMPAAESVVRRCTKSDPETGKRRKHLWNPWNRVVPLNTPSYPLLSKRHTISKAAKRIENSVDRLLEGSAGAQRYQVAMVTYTQCLQISTSNNV